MRSTRKKEGFQGQKAIVIPRRILSGLCATDAIVQMLYVTDIGFYPKARYHFRQRTLGAEQHILIYCYEGKGEVTLDNKKLVLEAGDFCIIPKKQPHAYAADDKNPWTIYWLHCKGEKADAMIALIKEKFDGLKGFIRQKEKFIEFFNEMYERLERGYSSDHLRYANMCLWHFFSSIIYSDNEAIRKTMHKDAMEDAISFLKSNIDQSLTLGDIAASVNLSVPHFSFLFKKKTGFSPIDYFNHLKVQEACRYLLFTDLRVKEIALQLGFSDQYYFSRMFSKVMGMPPNEYREKRVQ
ncbi:MAG TPA: AraC family transcriptional regulator [Phnomibacter sp.]|nr:AraC family transcriptional regulator [Phnomibacter sp.]